MTTIQQITLQLGACLAVSTVQEACVSPLTSPETVRGVVFKERSISIKGSSSVECIVSDVAVLQNVVFCEMLRPVLDDHCPG